MNEIILYLQAVYLNDHEYEGLLQLSRHRERSLVPGALGMLGFLRSRSKDHVFAALCDIETAITLELMGSSLTSREFMKRGLRLLGKEGAKWDPLIRLCEPWGSENGNAEAFPDASTQYGKLVEILSEAPATRIELLERMYADTGSFWQKENRLKNLLARFRKKYPSLLIFVDGKYSLSIRTHWTKIA